MPSYEFSGKSIQDAVRQAAKELNVAEDDFTWEILEKPTKGFLGFGSKDGRIRVTLKEESFNVADLFEEEPSALTETSQNSLQADPAPNARKEAPTSAEEPKEVAERMSMHVESEAAEAATELEIIELESIDEEEKAHTELHATAPKEEETVLSDAESLEVSEEAGIEDVAMRFLGPIFEALETNPVVRIEESEKEVLFKVDGDHVGLLIGRRGETLRALQLLLSVVVRREVKTNKRILLDVADYKVRRADSLEKLALRMADKARKSGRKVRLDPMNPAERRLVHLALEKEQDLSTYSEGKDPYRRIVIVPEA